MVEDSEGTIKEGTEKGIKEVTKKVSEEVSMHNKEDFIKTLLEKGVPAERIHDTLNYQIELIERVKITIS